MKRTDNVSLFTDILSVLRLSCLSNTKPIFLSEARLSCITDCVSLYLQCWGANGKLAWLAIANSDQHLICLILSRICISHSGCRLVFFLHKLVLGVQTKEVFYTLYYVSIR